MALPLVRWSEIAFDDVVPDGVEPYECWSAIGMDASGRVYMGCTSARADGRDDVAVFRYDPRTGERRCLGTLLQAAAAAGNARDGESIPKGHTRLILLDGRMYMGSQGFHDLKGSLEDLPGMRGAHLFAYDVAEDAWEDLSAPLPGGVVTAHQGIVSLDALPEQHLLVGLTHPGSDIVLYNYRSRQVVGVLPGIPWSFGNPVSRELIAAPTGRVFTYRGTERLDQREERHPIYVHDLRTRRMSETRYSATEGFWVGKTATRDGATIYLSTTNGRLYRFDARTEAFDDLGHLLPAAEAGAGRRVDLHYALTLSPDEQQIFFISAQISNPDGAGELYAYSIASGAVSFVQQVPPGVYTSGDVRDERRLYFAHFGIDTSPWHGRPRLFILEVEPE